MLPWLQPTKQYKDLQMDFLGINRNLRADPRQWKDTTNVSPREYPGFAPRVRRGIGVTLAAPAGLLARDALVYIDGPTLYINSLPVTGLALLTTPDSVPKQLVNMGAFIIILPDKKYVNTADLSDYGSIDQTFTFTGDVQLTPSRVDGTDLPMDGIVVGTQPPAEPVNGSYWIDTTGEIHELKQYSSMSASWTLVPSTFTRIALPGIGAFFQKMDGVKITGLNYSDTDPDLLKQIPLLNGTKIIEAIQPDYIIVSGLLSKVHTLVAATVTVERRMPDMDFVTESENRLWGCKYGLVDGKAVNEIYASALGDFKNWNRFAGIATDSYGASVGTDGKFTGAITFQGYPLFFKETAMHKVFGSNPPYQIETYNCRGLQEGSWRSLQIVNELLFYKGRTDVLVYDGSDPVSISEHLGHDTYRNAVAGAFKRSYYISMQDELGQYHMYLYDTRLKMWWRQDDTKAMMFAQVDDDLLYIDEWTNNIVSMFGKSGVAEASVPFEAVTGIIGYEQKDHKYISRFNIRARVPADGSFRVFLRYDSVGDWVEAGSVTGAGLVRSVMMPVRPRRCDHFEMKLTGTNDVRIFSIAKVLEVGSDGRWS